MTLTRLVSYFGLIVFTALPALSYHPLASFREIAQSADLVFIGTVDRYACRLNDGAKMIVTDVFFREITILHAGPRARQAGTATITLTHAGGELGDIGLSVSGVPHFTPGRRYVVFMLDDGEPYATPLVGGAQGCFEVEVDPLSGSASVTTSGGRPVTGFDGLDLQFGARSAEWAQRLPMYDPDRGRTTTPPVPAAPGDEAHASIISRPGSAGGPAIRIEEFLGFLRRSLSAPAVEHPVLRPPGPGTFWEREGEQMVARPIPSRSAISALPLQHKPPSMLVPMSDGVSASAQAIPQAPLGTILATCGYFAQKIVMEQVSTSDISYTPNNESMWIWNQFMDLFRYTPDDGTYGGYPGNTQNEFVGFLSDADMFAEYGYHWGTAIGMTMRYYNRGDKCGRTLQADVMLNPSDSWTNDPLYSYDNTGTYLIRRVLMHELGHVWGLANGYDPELYDYDVPTVMHAASRVVEDGSGIHRSDAYLFRRLYTPLTPVIARVDMGVESYYASGGLKNSTWGPQYLQADQGVTFDNVTVENMSTNDVANVRLRFYLSTDRTITTSDYLMGSYFEWSLFPAESQDVSSYSVRIPPGIAPGTYYVGAIVTVNGFNSDDFPSNNTTFFIDPLTVLPHAEIAVNNPAIDLGAHYASSPFTSGFTVSNPGTFFSYSVTIAETSLWITSLTPSTFTLTPGQSTPVTISGTFPVSPGNFTSGIAVNSPAGNLTVQVSGSSVVNPPSFTRILTGPVATDKATSVGCSWGDFDSDGREDLYVTNFYANNALYKNFGSGVFRKMTTGPQVNDGGNSNAATWGDYDNDGNLDLCVANGGSEKSVLYRNSGSGIFTTVPDSQFATEIADARGCSWVDYDNDGNLDLFIASYGKNFLYRNRGNGTFSSVPDSPVSTTRGSSTCGSWCDLDNDGDQDLLVTNYYTRNFLFINNGNGTFTPITDGPLVTDSGYTCGASWGDYDNDGLMDVYITHTNRNRNSLFHNQGSGVFTRVTTGEIANDSLFSAGSSWMDFNNDGFLDLFVARGGPFTANEVLYQGYGNGTFTRVTGPNGEFSDRGMSFGCASADYDQDGDVDVAVVNASDPFLNYLYSNNGTANAWVEIRCVGSSSNRSAIGARVLVKARIGGTIRQQIREISGQTGSSGQSSLVAHFGLRDASVIDEITVRWPSGAVQVLTSQPVNQLITINEQATLPPPLQLTALSGYMNQIPLVWNPPAGSAAQQVRRYTLHRFTQVGTPSKEVKNILTPYYRDSTPNTGEPFIYLVDAVYDAGESGPSNTVLAQAPTSGYTIRSTAGSSVPRIDGVITPGEWSGAASADVTVPGATGQVTAYVMNAANMLFLAVDDTRDATLDSNDTVGLFVDGDGDRGWPSSTPSREGLLQLYQSGRTHTAVNAFLPIRGLWPGSMLSEGWTTPGGVLQQISASRGHVQYEASIHLNTGPFRLTPGGPAGFLVYVWDGRAGDFTGIWPQETFLKLPAFCSGYTWAYGPFSYGDVNLGSSSTIGVEITFSVTVPEATPAADTVFLSGNFNSWDPGPATTAVDGFHHDLRMVRAGPRQWTLTLPFVKGETIEYKYTRGAWTSVEKGIQGEEIANRTLTIPDTGAVRSDAVARWADVVGLPGNPADDIPKEPSLAQNFPNPFNGISEIGFQISEWAWVRLLVYDLLGKEVAVLVDERKAPGRYHARFDAGRLASGMYVCRMSAGAFVATKKMLLTR